MSFEKSRMSNIKTCSKFYSFPTFCRTAVLNCWKAVRSMFIECVVSYSVAWMHVIFLLLFLLFRNIFKKGKGGEMVSLCDTATMSDLLRISVTL